MLTFQSKHVWLENPDNVLIKRENCREHAGNTKGSCFLVCAAGKMAWQPVLICCSDTVLITKLSLNFNRSMPRSRRKTDMPA